MGVGKEGGECECAWLHDWTRRFPYLGSFEERAAREFGQGHVQQGRVRAGAGACGVDVVVGSDAEAQLVLLGAGVFVPASWGGGGGGLLRTNAWGGGGNENR